MKLRFSINFESRYFHDPWIDFKSLHINSLKRTHMQLYNSGKKTQKFPRELGHQNYSVRVNFRDKSNGAKRFLLRPIYRLEKWTESQNIVSPFHQHTFIKGYFELNLQYEVDSKCFWFS